MIHFYFTWKSELEQGAETNRIILYTGPSVLLQRTRITNYHIEIYVVTLETGQRTINIK